MTSGPLIKIHFDCDIADTHVDYYLSREIALDVGIWEIAFESVSFSSNPFQDDDLNIFDIRCSLVKDISRIDVLEHTSLNRFSNADKHCVKDGCLRWYLINNYHSDHISFYLTSLKLQRPERNRVKLSFEILLRRIK